MSLAKNKIKIFEDSDELRPMFVESWWRRKYEWIKIPLNFNLECKSILFTFFHSKNSSVNRFLAVIFLSIVILMLLAQTSLAFVSGASNIFSIDHHHSDGDAVLYPFWFLIKNSKYKTNPFIIIIIKSFSFFILVSISNLFSIQRLMEIWEYQLYRLS